ncbi:hypothetical protein BS17DRAFT_197973 [Gyrodon lividus]|nr:hypothetical protein BS17DRAFT_197973 [Gyrodon lividus]
MSSEESSLENGVENILRVKQMEWRRNIDHELEIIDRERIIDSDIFSAQGSKPLPRKRATDNPPTSRNPVDALPLALYDSAWLLRLTERQSEILQASKVTFPWKKFNCSPRILHWMRYRDLFVQNNYNYNYYP